VGEDETSVPVNAFEPIMASPVPRAVFFKKSLLSMVYSLIEEKELKDFNGSQFPRIQIPDS
jgi:hypothetical protein